MKPRPKTALSATNADRARARQLRQCKVCSGLPNVRSVSAATQKLILQQWLALVGWQALQMRAEERTP